MLIIGAKGFSKEVLEIFHDQGRLENIAFFDDINDDIGDVLYGQFPILKNENDVLHYFREFGDQFTIGIGNPGLRFKLFEKFKNLGGSFTSSISPKAQIGNYDVQIGTGSNVLANSIFSNSTVIGNGCIVYYNVTITHDCKVGDFVELSPGVTLLGYSKIGDFSQIGANVTILPNIKVGRNVIIGAGAIITKDIRDNCVVVGIPGKIVRDNF